MVRVSAKMAGIAAAGLAVVLLPGFSGPAFAGGTAALSGKVSLQREGVAGAQVFAYGSLEEMAASRPAAVSEGTDEEGLYRLELPPGTYYLTAVGDGRFSYHGSNPFFLAAGDEAPVSFPLAPRDGEPRVTAGSDPAGGALTGVALLDGEPAEGVRVKLYLDGDSNFRGMGYSLSPPTGPDGAFRFDYLPESSYYVVAHRRSGGADAGPLDEGDAYGFYAGNPVYLASGTEASITLSLAGKGDGTGGAEGKPRLSGTAITGRITAGDGSVVPGVYAFAYRDRLMSHAKPDHLSRAVDGEGRYVIHLDAGGTFYVGARMRYGDAPARGEWYGRYDGTADHAVSVPAGRRLEGVDIVVERIIQ